MALCLSGQEQSGPRTALDETESVAKDECRQCPWVTSISGHRAVGSTAVSRLSTAVTTATISRHAISSTTGGPGRPCKKRPVCSKGHRDGRPGRSGNNPLTSTNGCQALFCGSTQMHRRQPARVAHRPRPRYEHELLHAGPSLSHTRSITRGPDHLATYRDHFNAHPTRRQRDSASGCLHVSPANTGHCRTVTDARSPSHGRHTGSSGGLRPHRRSDGMTVAALAPSGSAPTGGQWSANT
jgi:hypothetical protein